MLPDWPGTSRELQLLLASARVTLTPRDKSSIRQLLGGDIDWTVFARKAMMHEVACVTGHTLLRVAPDMVPEAILEAFRAILDHTRSRNRKLLEELAEVTKALTEIDVEALAQAGPVLALQAYGDTGLRVGNRLSVLLHEKDVLSAMTCLKSLGYEPVAASNDGGIRDREGQWSFYNKTLATELVIQLKLTSSAMVVDIDYGGLWIRAKHIEVNGRIMRNLAPEDALLALAIRGSEALWSKIKDTCDIAAYIGAHQNLDWAGAFERARAQGNLRRVLLASALARRYFDAAVPERVKVAESNDPLVGSMTKRVLDGWDKEAITPLADGQFSLAQVRLHDGLRRQARYAMQTLSRRKISIQANGQRFARPFIDRTAIPGVARLFGPIAYSNLALALIPASTQWKRESKRRWEAYSTAKQRVDAAPGSWTTLRGLGDALVDLRQYKAAIAYYDKALAVRPDERSTWRRRAAVSAALGETFELPDFALKPQNAVGWALRAGSLSFGRRFLEAAEASDRALALDPDNLAAKRIGIHSRLYSCDWRRREEDERAAKSGMLVSSALLSVCESEAENCRVTSQFLAATLPPAPDPLWRGERYRRHDKIRIAYVSADFRAHATAFLLAGVLEHHDRERFETTAISLSADDGSDMRRRLKFAFDRFVDGQSMTDSEIAALLRKLEIDIAIDLEGYTGSSRTKIFALRPAPVQVNYLAYPGTMGVPYIDYIIADHTVISEENRIYYSEQVVYMPHTYQPNDTKRIVATSTPSRAEAGLPDAAFVYTCLNNSYKITPAIFTIWMRLLSDTPNSVLWLLEDNLSASLNLRREAKVRGVAPERLVFAPRKSPAEHLARHRLADLFLDTLPYNAHTTASDALWMGLPMVTCIGNTFPARVGASLLIAMGLRELVTYSLTEYEEVARSLAKDGARLTAIKAKLMRNRDTEPLFDTRRYTLHLESAYQTMFERQQNGLPPATFEVAS